MFFGLLATSFLFFSFAGSKGGEVIQIFLNGKLVMEQYVSMEKTVRTLQLGSGSANDKLDIYYSHCGRTGTDRTIAVKDEKNNVLKTWKFANAKEKSGMTIIVKDILNLQKNKETKFNLVYTSQELPAGKTIALIDLGNKSFAKR